MQRALACAHPTPWIQIKRRDGAVALIGTICQGTRFEKRDEIERRSSLCGVVVAAVSIARPIGVASTGALPATAGGVVNVHTVLGGVKLAKRRCRIPSCKPVRANSHHERATRPGWPAAYCLVVGRTYRCANQIC